MAKKSRTPAPPRRKIQAPQKRSDQRTPRERRTLLYLMLFAGSGIVILAAVLGFVAFAGGGGGSGSKSVTASKYCVEKVHPGQDPKHLQNVDTKVKYNSFPPSSGPHYFQPSPWGIFGDPIKETILVHNLEHGGIIIQYGPGVSSADVEKLTAFYQKDPYGLVVAPYAKLGNKIAAAAWNEPAYRAEGDFKGVNPGKGYTLTCSRFDEQALAQFRDGHRNKAGERYQSVKDMAPGA